MREDAAWNELLDEFCALGGTAENLCLKRGEFGRGLFPKDPTKPICLRVPENLLFDVGDIVFDQGVLRVNASSQVGNREKAWFERYENEFSWGGGGGAEVERFRELLQALPASPRDVLVTEFGLRAWLEEASDEWIQKQFLGSRVMQYREHKVIMPILELANHGPVGYLDCRDGISVTGQFGDEVLIHYGRSDAWARFLKFGFASDEPEAFSLPLTLTGNFGDLVVVREIDKGEFIDVPSVGRVMLPHFVVDGERATLSFLILGMTKAPGVPRGVLNRLFLQAGISDALDKFDLIQHANRMNFLKLLGSLERLDGPLVWTLRQMSRFQLQAMSHCYGMIKV